MKNVPKHFEYLLRPDMPKVVQEGVKLLGTKEFKGSKHNPVILGWARTLGIEKLVKDDEQAWCGLAHAVVLLRAGKPAQLTGWDLLRALSYQNYGVKVKTPGLGDTLVFKRTGGGHVGIYVGEDGKYYWVMGGNQNDEYNIVKILKNRCVAIRRPLYNIQPATVVPMIVKADGTVTSNES